jgi:hypothetical protein
MVGSVWPMFFTVIVADVLVVFVKTIGNMRVFVSALRSNCFPNAVE